MIHYDLIMGSGRDAHDDVVSLLAAKDAEIAALVARVTQLEGLVAALQARLGRDSSNSGKPPSSDSPFIKKPAAKRSVRTRSGKPQGKQPGAPSATLRLIADPDDTITHIPSVCAGCGDGLIDAEVFGMCRHQVVDLPPPPPRPYVTEHRVQSRTCGGCGTVTEASAPGVASGRVQYGPGVKARAAWLTCAHFLPVRRARRVLNALLGFAVSDGWVAGLRAQAARLLETRFLPHVRALIAAAPVAHADETTARAEGALTYLHVACTRFLTAMHVGDRSTRHHRRRRHLAGVHRSPGPGRLRRLRTPRHDRTRLVRHSSGPRLTRGPRPRPSGSVLGRGDGEYLAAGQ